MTLLRYGSTAICQAADDEPCTPSKKRRITRWGHRHLVGMSRNGAVPTPTPCEPDARQFSIPSTRRHGIACLAYDLTHVMNVVGKAKPDCGHPRT
jgi:hypothetical protein